MAGLTDGERLRPPSAADHDLDRTELLGSLGEPDGWVNAFWIKQQFAARTGMITAVFDGENPGQRPIKNSSISTGAMFSRSITLRAASAPST